MEKAGEVLKRFLEKKGIQLSNEYSSLFDGWSSLVDDSMARHSRVVDIDGCVLVVEVDHPGFAQLIGLKKQYLISKLNDRYKKVGIKDIRVAIKRLRKV